MKNMHFPVYTLLKIIYFSYNSFTNVRVKEKTKLKIYLYVSFKHMYYKIKLQIIVYLGKL